MKKLMSAVAALAVTLPLATVQAAPEPATRQGAKEEQVKPPAPTAEAKSAVPLRERALRSEIKARSAEMRKKLVESGALQDQGRQ
ncbi:hypothetical protein GPEL0_01r1821 [Geoanaerobacter pelophilus]|uniref:Uncharacterized protein n=1 Tax=Geoanaerobacter pelophilus TaxID=60036 RepID=A0ABQ0MI24_9BACT|nr:hypothetical protein [Geoanaerobacter pelophilus]GAW66447.1 hypothetical protein GPEL0_01r1821 [Geoanaerobacter pelophilus]